MRRDGVIGVTRSCVTVEVRGRRATIEGELLVRVRGEPDFVASSKQIAWEDGAPITEADREEIVRLLHASKRIRVDVV